MSTLKNDNIEVSSYNNEGIQRISKQQMTESTPVPLGYSLFKNSRNAANLFGECAPASNKLIQRKIIDLIIHKLMVTP